MAFDLNPVRTQVIEAAEDRIRKSAPQLLQRLRDAAPVAAEGGGFMRDSIRVTTRLLGLEVEVPVDYASYTTEDTQPHEIVATRAQALRFFWNRVGPPQPRFFRSVQHPGTSGTIDWYHPVLEDWTMILDRLPVPS